jgi:response regulator RpfG family c-di-GMP phosphodiesterase
LVHGIHGINHTKRVLFLVELLAALENLAEPERDILSVAAVYHDIGRVSDGADHTWFCQFQ